MKTLSKIRQKGALLIELVLTLPILLAVIFAIVEYSVMLGGMMVMSNTASEAARQTTVYRSNFSRADYETAARNSLRDLLPTYVGSFRTRVVSTVTSSTCGDSVCLRLRLEYPNYNRNPIVGNSFFIPLPGRLMAEATTRIEPRS